MGLFIYLWPPMFYLTHKSHFISSLHSCRHEQTCTSQISFVFTVSQLKVRDMNRRVHIHICALAIYNSGGTENTLLWSDNINISNLPQSLIPTHQRERAGGEKESERERKRERERERASERERERFTKRVRAKLSSGNNYPFLISLMSNCQQTYITP